MKKFLLRVFIYLLVVIVSGYTVQYFVDAGLHKYNAGNFGIWNNIFSGAINSDLLIQGSSRALVQFDTKIIEESTGLSSFNMGISGGKFIEQKAKWEAYIANNKPPRIILQSVDLMTLTKEDYIFNKVQYLPYLSDAAISSNLEKIDRGIWLEKIIPLYKYRGFRNEFFAGLRSYFKNTQSQSIYYKGFVGVDKIWNRDFSKFRLQNEKLIYSEENLKFGFEFLEDELKECRLRGIKVILVHAPLYIELLKIMPQKPLIDSVFQGLARKYGMEYWDFTHESLCYSQEYFYNSTHLNSKGAKIFSKNLSEKLNEYLLDLNIAGSKSSN